MIGAMWPSPDGASQFQYPGVGKVARRHTASAALFFSNGRWPHARLDEMPVAYPKRSLLRGGLDICSISQSSHTKAVPRPTTTPKNSSVRPGAVSMVSIHSAMQGAYQPLPLREIVPSDGTHAPTGSFGFRRNNGQASIASLNSHLVMRSNAPLPLPCGNLRTPISLRTLHERSGSGGVETGTASSRGKYSSPCDRPRCFRHRSRHR